MTNDAPFRSAHPRLFLVVVAGVLGLLVGAAMATADATLDTGTGLLGFRVGIVGFLLFVGGASGYVAIRVFQTHPEA